MHSHPENDPHLKVELPEELQKELDFDASRLSQLTEDGEDHPLYQLERHRQSLQQAVFFAASTIFLTLLAGLMLALTSHALGGPLCDAGVATWICSHTFELFFPLLPGAIALAGLIGCALGCYKKYKNHDRWQPWLAALWVLLPFTLMWLTGTGTMAIVGH